MKTTLKTTTCLLAALSGLAIAQDPSPAAPGAPPPTPPHPPTPGIAGRADEIRREIFETIDANSMDAPIRWTYRHGAMEDEPVRSGPVTFLGVSATPPPRELAAHLPIEADTGLLVEVVAPDSPAEKAGLQASDVLTKIDDQILIHPRQLSVLVANKKEGDSVRITYIRKGESREASAMLGKREVERFSTHYPNATVRDFAGLPGAPGDPRADILLEGHDGGPLRTFIRRFEIPGGGDMKIVGSMSSGGGGGAGMAAVPSTPAPAPPDDDVKKELAEIRAMLEALQQKLK